MKKPNQDVAKEVESISPDFPVVRRQQPPAGYFEALPDRMLQRWKQESSGRSHRPFPFSRMVAAAAMFTGLCLGILWLTKYTQQQDRSASITSAEAFEYILQHVEEFEPLLLDNATFSESVPLEQTPAEAVEEFLLDELSDVDIETLF